MSPSSRAAFVLSLLVALAACGPRTPAADAGVDSTPQPVDVASDAPDAADASVTDTGCANVAGYFELASTCTAPQPPRNACVTQTGCALTAATDLGTLTGTVTDGSVTLTGMTVAGAMATCTGDVMFGALNLSCDLGGAAACMLTGTRNNVPGASRVCCSVSAQDCGAGQKCNLVSVANPDGISTTACLPTTGTVAEGMPCARMPVGYDDCAAGLYCAGTGSPAGMTACRRLCAVDSDCGAADVCVTTGSGPLGGFCVARCDVFGAACATGLGCALAVGFTGANAEAGETICAALGTAAVGAACMANTDCASGLCGGTTCVAPCNATHACTGTATCTMYGGLATGVDLGFCMPTP